jgi:DNA-binding NarL/FixJ family response regulator
VQHAPQRVARAGAIGDAWVPSDDRHATGATVVVADDHAPTRERVADALAADGFVVCARVADAAAAVGETLRHRPDVCLLDIHMPGSGIAAAAEVHACLPQCAIVMLTVSTAPDDLFAALRAGAVGYLLKEIESQRVGRALDHVLEGEVAIPRTLVGLLTDEFRGREAHRRRLSAPGIEAQLTAREWQVLDFLKQGLATAEIAERLVVSPGTVRTHVSALLRKLHMQDRAELVSRFGGRRLVKR